MAHIKVEIGVILLKSLVFLEILLLDNLA